MYSYSLLLLLLGHGILLSISLESALVAEQTFNPKIQVQSNLSDAFLPSRNNSNAENVNSTAGIERILLGTERLEAIRQLLDYPAARFWGNNDTGILADFSISELKDCQTAYFHGDIPEYMDSFGTCVRLFRKQGCRGDSISIYPGRDLSILQEHETRLSSFPSVGPCLKNEFEFASISKNKINGEVIVSKSVVDAFLDVPDFLQVDFGEQSESSPDGLRFQELIPIGGVRAQARVGTDKLNRTIQFSLRRPLEKKNKNKVSVGKEPAVIATIINEEKSNAAQDIKLFKKKPGDSFGSVILRGTVGPGAAEAEIKIWESLKHYREQDKILDWVSALNDNEKWQEEWSDTAVSTILVFLYRNEGSRSPYGLLYNYMHGKKRMFGFIRM